MRQAATILSFSEKRLAGLLRRAALQHVRHELRAARETLSDARFLLDWSERTEWATAADFVGAWSEAIGREIDGKTTGTAPAAWIHLSQELASLIDSQGDWVSYLATRWSIEPGELPVTRRLVYAFLSLLALGLAALIIGVLARHALLGHWDWLATSPMRSPKERILTLVLIVGRVAGTVMMIEHGILWGKRALTGGDEEPRVRFRGLGEGLALVETTER